MNQCILAFLVLLLHLLSQDVIIHECTARFTKDIFEKHLGDLYDVLSLERKKRLISPEDLGWPCSRPHKHTVLLKKGRVTLSKEFVS